MKYICSVCGYIYDEEREKTLFADLPESWKCPVCKAAKSAFEPRKPKEEAKLSRAPAAPSALEEDFMKMSAGELAALCSNLARGCEKQYRAEEAELFRQIADYFTSVNPAVPDADIEQLAALFRDDLRNGYPSVRTAADATGDRGTGRICVWGEKVTNMLDSLIAQYRQEGEAFLADTQVWVCSVCGFVYTGDEPPKNCPVCKVPDWKFEKIEGRDSA